MKKPSLHIAFLAPLLLAAVPFMPSRTLADTPLERLDRQVAEYPQEKVHVMTDRDVYCGGDTIWMRIFVVDGTTHRPLSISKYAYAEVRDPFGGVLERVKIKEEDGVYAGYIPLREDIAEGDYMLTAYTAFMENAGEEYFFRRRLPLLTPWSSAYAIDAEFEPAGDGKTSGHFSLRSLKGSSMRFEKMRWETPDGKELEMVGSKNGFKKTFNKGKGEDRVLVKFGDYAKYFAVPHPSDKTDVAFCPEGGYLIPDMMCRVAFKATDEYGAGTPLKGRVLDDTGDEIKEFEVSHMGMGEVSFIPEAGRTYHAEYVNPDGTEGRAEIGAPSADAAVVRVGSAGSRCVFSVAGNTDRPLELLLACRGAGEMHAPISASTPLTLAKSELPTGLHQAILYSPQDSAVLSERLFFIGADRPSPKVAELAPDSMSITLRAPEGTEADVAIRITNSRLAPSDRTSDIRTQLLLQSELRGRIENPAQYFREDDREAASNLDLVMLTNGWSRYDIPEALKGHYAEPEIPLEIGQEITGQVRSRWRNRPLADVMVCAIAPKVGFATYADTDENGEFHINGFDFPEDTPFILQAMNEKGGLEGNFEAYPEKFPSITGLQLDRDATPRADISEYFNGSKWTMLDEITVQAYKPKEHTIYETLAACSRTSAELERKGFTTLDEALRGLPGVTEIMGYLTYRQERVSYYIDGVLVENENERAGGKYVRPFAVTGHSHEITRVFSTPLPRQDAPSPSLAEMAAKIPFQAIARIDFLRPEHAMILGRNYSGGAIMITTKDGSEVSWTRQYELQDFLPFGYQERKEYASPLLSATFDEYDMQTEPTLLWLPSVKIKDVESKLSLASHCGGDCEITVEGISSDGSLIK